MSISPTSSAREAIVLSPEARALLFTDARTANAFIDEPVTDEQLQAIFTLSKWPPTMANTNPASIPPASTASSS